MSKFFIQLKLKDNFFSDYSEPQELLGANTKQEALKESKKEIRSENALEQAVIGARIFELVGEIEEDEERWEGEGGAGK